jgi:hypothetical protein
VGNVIDRIDSIWQLENGCNVIYNISICYTDRLQHELRTVLISIKLKGSFAIMANRTHIATKFGNIELEFYSDAAPKTVENF